jgi:hypothetical protein
LSFCPKNLMLLLFYKFSKFDRNTVSFNGKESTVNRALGGGSYPS